MDVSSRAARALERQIIGLTSRDDDDEHDNELDDSDDEPNNNDVVDDTDDVVGAGQLMPSQRNPQPDTTQMITGTSLSSLS